MVTALPHSEVEAKDFYKHIESEGLPEPRRMRQLLTWCATRSLGEKPSGQEFEDHSARMAARVIQEELLKDLANRSEMSDWFSREDAPKAAAPMAKRPNPKNQQNADKIAELELQMKRYAGNASGAKQKADITTPGYIQSGSPSTRFFRCRPSLQFRPTRHWTELSSRNQTLRCSKL